MTNKAKSNNVYVKIVGFFLFLTIVAIFAILHFALAKATIKIFSQTDTNTGTVLVEMQAENSEEKSPDAILGKIISTEFELETTVPSSQENVPSEKAGGYVTIINNYSKNQALVATTRLLTPDGKLFRITEKINVPAGGSIEVWAEADEGGEQFITEATKFIIPGLWIDLQEYIYAETATGMNLQAVPQYIVSQDNIDQAMADIEALAITQAIDQINELLVDALKINASRLSLEFETLESNVVGETSKEAYLKQKVRGYAVIFDESSLKNIAEEKFTKELDGEQSLIEFLPEGYSYKVVETYIDENKAILEVSLSAKISTNEKKLDIDKEKLIGQGQEGIKKYLQDLNINDAEVSFFPPWIDKAPKLKDHIIIE
ncbi:hypothetical protein HON36_02605 [Candidatus Parcubacteria bacterium]|jgi:hypothetical protein|nr:hypothetical protein [Candidatus Parcubacteria bacterium]